MTDLIHNFNFYFLPWPFTFAKKSIAWRGEEEGSGLEKLAPMLPLRSGMLLLSDEAHQAYFDVKMIFYTLNA